jgi:hypothetical protein
VFGVGGEFFVGAGGGLAEQFGAVGVVFGDEAERILEFGAPGVGAERGGDSAA